MPSKLKEFKLVILRKLFFKRLFWLKSLVNVPELRQEKNERIYSNTDLVKVTPPLTLK